MKRLNQRIICKFCFYIPTFYKFIKKLEEIVLYVDEGRLVSNEVFKLLNDKGLVNVKDPVLKIPLTDKMEFFIKNRKVYVKFTDPGNRNLFYLYKHLYRKTIRNFAIGKVLELVCVGMGYKMLIQGGFIILKTGLSHNIYIKRPSNMLFKNPSYREIYIYGFDYDKLRRFGYLIRSFNPPNIYTGKGIMFKGEVLKRKQGKISAY